MNTLLITAMLLSACCGVTTGKDNPTLKPGEFNHRLTSHWREGTMKKADAQNFCMEKGQRLLSINSWRELNRLLNELTEMNRVPGLLKSPETKTVKLWTDNKVDFLGDKGHKRFTDLNDEGRYYTIRKGAQTVKLWIDNKVNFLGDKGHKRFTDLNDEGRYCAILVIDDMGKFHIEGQECSSKTLTVACIRDDLYKNIIVGQTSGEDQLDSVTHTEVAKECKDRGMELFKIASALDQTNLGAELNRLGYPRIDNPGPHVFYLGNKVGGNPGDTVNFTDLSSGDNCLIMKSRSDPDSRGGKYDMMVDDCTGGGRAVCTGLPVQGKFYRRLIINLMRDDLSFKVARYSCQVPYGMYELPVIETRQDMDDLSAELVRLGVHRYIVQSSPEAFIWLENTFKVVKNYYLSFDNLNLERRDSNSSGMPNYCVAFSNEMSPTESDGMFKPVDKLCDTKKAISVCVLKEKGAKLLRSFYGY